MKALLEKYRDVIPYAVFGVLTTLVNIISYWFLAHMLSCSVMAATVTAWILSVVFAYITNRKWVFHSDAHEFAGIFRECAYFFACRLLTGAADTLNMYLFVERLQMNDVVIKILSNIVVIILNYAASKWIIFKHEK